MKFLSLTLALMGLYVQQASAVYWYFLRYYTPSDTVQFTKFSMEMIAPTLASAGTYYLWPGLQDVGTSGVYQSVLDGRSGDWWIGAGWCCSDPTVAWGSGFNVAAGGVITIDMVLDPTSTNWTTTLSYGSTTVVDVLPIGYKNMNQALFTLELYTEAWNLSVISPLVFKNVEMVVNTTETSWCTDAPENYDSSTTYALTNVVATVSGGSTHCTIAEVNMKGPA